MAKTAPTQEYLNIGDIRDDILILRNGELRQVLEVKALNFALKSEQEQAAIVYQYQAFLNSLQFAIQIVVQSRRLDLTQYLLGLRERVSQTPSPLMQQQTIGYLDFVARLITLGNIMEKRFFVVVPYASSGIRGRNIVSQVLRRETVNVDEAAFTDAKAKLADRVESVRGGLASIGLQVNILPSDEVTKLLYSTYNPAEAGEIPVQPQAPS